MRPRVETAANLAAIGKAEKDGDLLLAAAKLLSKVDAPVALQGAELKDGKPASFALSTYLDEAKALGADTSKAPMSKPQPAASQVVTKEVTGRELHPAMPIAKALRLGPFAHTGRAHEDEIARRRLVRQRQR